MGSCVVLGLQLSNFLSDGFFVGLACLLSYLSSFFFFVLVLTQSGRKETRTVLYILDTSVLISILGIDVFLSFGVVNDVLCDCSLVSKILGRGDVLYRYNTKQRATKIDMKRSMRYD